VRNFADRTLGEHAKAIPYRVYDLADDNRRLGNVADVADTAEFAVNPIRTRWDQRSRERFPS
jgi:Rhodopirellula transposase DDE domain